MKSYVLLFFWLVGLPGLVQADLYEEAEAAFSNGAYQEALTKTEKLLADINAGFGLNFKTENFFSFPVFVHYFFNLFNRPERFIN